ncbi:MAG: redoxin domain-containing protein [Planctomycetota bacterium]
MSHRIPSPRAAAAITLFALALANPVAAQEPHTLDRGAKAPDFVSIDTKGKEVHLADFANKVVVLDFWATWCAPCVASMPHVQEIAKAHKADGVVVLAVCTSDSRKKFDAWVAEHAADYPDIVFTCDPKETGSDDFENRASRKLYGISGLPTKFVIGRDGNVALTMVGNENDDLRLEAGLARAGIAIDAAIASKGEAQSAAEMREAKARAAEAAAHPVPSFFPVFGSIKAGDAMPDFTLVDADGKEVSTASLRGKPTVIVMAWADVMPRPSLQEMQERFGKYGVQTLGMFVFTSSDEYHAWVAENRDRVGFRTAMDPAGKFAGDAKDFQARIKFNEGTVVHRFFTGNMLPGMPACVVADAKGVFAGYFGLGARWHDGLANLLLHCGVKLQPDDMPKEVAKPEDFQPPAPREAEAPVKPIELGVAAPDFVAQDIDGKDVRLSDFRGKVVVLDFWATWCGPCKASLPHTQAVADRYQDAGVVVIASCTSDERANFVSWVKAHQLDYPRILFTHDPNERKAQRASRALYGVSGIPHQFIIDRDGKLVAQVSGYRPGEVLLEGALHEAGIAIAPELLEKAKADLKARDEGNKKQTPSVPMQPMQPKR